MSEYQVGEQWWQASDGKWYPPETRPPSATTPASIHAHGLVAGGARAGATNIGTVRRRSGGAELGASVLRCVVGAALAATVVGLGWYLIQHKLALGGDWLSGAVGGALAGLGGAVVGVWASDRGQRGGVPASLLAAVAGSAAVFVAGTLALDGTLVTEEALGASFWSPSVVVGAVAAFVAVRSGARARETNGVGGLVVLGVVAAALVAVVVVRSDSDAVLSRRLQVATTTTTVAPEVIAACATERARLEEAAALADDHNAIDPGRPRDPESYVAPTEYGTHYRWIATSDGFSVIPVGSPPC